jgi:hypothetical protein
VIIEAESEKDANDEAAIMEDEEIEKNEISNTGYVIWNEAREIKI